VGSAQLLLFLPRIEIASSDAATQGFAGAVATGFLGRGWSNPQPPFKKLVILEGLEVAPSAMKNQALATALFASGVTSKPANGAGPERVLFLRCSTL
jgi:hypothetical protein